MAHRQTLFLGHLNNVFYNYLNLHYPFWYFLASTLQVIEFCLLIFWSRKEKSQMNDIFSDLACLHRVLVLFDTDQKFLAKLLWISKERLIRKLFI